MKSTCRISLCLITCLFLIFSVAYSVSAAPFPASMDLRFSEAAERRLFTGVPTFDDGLEALGDVNGDGFDDIEGWSVFDSETSTFLVFGSAESAPLQLARETIESNNGILIKPFASTRPAGDINGDGLADWFFRSFQPDATGVVFGKSIGYPSPFNIDRLAPGDVLWILDDPDESPELSDQEWGVAAAGDVNGDGIDDLIFNREVPENRNGDGVFDIQLLLGSATGLPDEIVIQNIFGTQSSQFNCTDCTTWNINIVAGGDVNADGFDDLVLFAELTGQEAFVVFGNADGLMPIINQDTLDGTTGFTVTGNTDGDRFSFPKIRISPDLNGDGIDDLLTYLSGHVSILYGKSNGFDPIVEIRNLDSSDGYFAENSGTPYLIGDINNDGLADWLSRDRHVPIFNRFGTSIVYGSAVLRDSIDIAQLDGQNGFRIDIGESVRSVIGAGDVNGDGRDDLLLGSENTYLLYGQNRAEGLSAPSDVRAVLGPGLIAIRWDKSASDTVTGYEIRRDNVVVAQLDSDTLVYEDTDVSNDIQYLYQVVAIDGAGQRSFIAGIQVSHDLVEEYPKLFGTVYSDTLAELFFPLTGRTNSVFRNAQEVARSNNQSYVDTAYSPAGQSYFVEVKSSNASGVVWLRSETLRLPESPPRQRPSIPRNLRYAFYSQNTIELFWTAPLSGTAAVAYEISRDGEVLVALDGRSYLDTDLDTASQYVYNIVALDSNGARSDPARLVVDVSLQRREIKVAPVLGLSAHPLSETSVDISWQISTIGIQPTRFDVFRNGGLIGTTNELSFTDDGLLSNHRYRYSVVGVIDDGRQTDHRFGGVNVVTLGKPKQPEEFRAAVYSTHTLELFWKRTNPSEPVVFRVFRDGEPLDRCCGQTSTGDSSLDAGTTYTYTLIAVSPHGVESDPVHLSVTTNSM